MSRIDEMRDFCFRARLSEGPASGGAPKGTGQMDWIHIVIGGAGVLLLVGFAAVLLEATYDAGFEQGFAQGRNCGRKEGTR